MKPGASTRLAWSLFAVTAALFGFALVGGLRATPTFSPTGVRVHIWAIVLLSVAFMTFSGVGALMASRNPRNAVGWLFVSIGACTSLALASVAYVETTFPARPWAEWVADWSSVLVFPQITFVLLLFPDGKLPSPRWRVVAWATMVEAVGLVMGSFTPYTPEDRVFFNPAGIEGLRGTILQDGNLGWVLLPVTIVAAAFSFVVRFRASAGQLRQQLKWFSLAAGLAAAGFLTQLATWGATALADGNNPWESAVVAAGLVVEVLCLTAIPVASGIAILRYHLYDIDIIINRTLVYASLTAVLAFTYIAATVSIGSLVRELTGQQENDIVVAASTLLVAGLFQPARTRIQANVDRRFYRSRFDAQRTVEAFSTRLQDEIDLDALSGELVAVVRNTMQPTQVSVWLKHSPSARG
ncbi:MAG: hypothetical protein M3454_17375 [Actinomycetota bacterium]|nr:hypothetical protein [Actinomycetota bacterium]